MSKEHDRKRVRHPRVFYGEDLELRHYQENDAFYYYQFMLERNNDSSKREYLLRTSSAFKNVDGKSVYVALTNRYIQVIRNSSSELRIKYRSITRIKLDEFSLIIEGNTKQNKVISIVTLERERDILYYRGSNKEDCRVLLKGHSIRTVEAIPRGF